MVYVCHILPVSSVGDRQQDYLQILPPQTIQGFLTEVLRRSVRIPLGRILRNGASELWSIWTFNLLISIIFFKWVTLLIYCPQYCMKSNHVFPNSVCTLELCEEFLKNTKARTLFPDLKDWVNLWHLIVLFCPRWFQWVCKGENRCCILTSSLVFGFIQFSDFFSQISIK